ncbi:dihydroorotase [Marivirga sp. S37H4]|uniref:Dihydroorotase n=1 Tax=Marivirga aurantiaca TaxID=2802615 RepID=A0A934WZE6_9BACT|nr:dihydroorotase [Marivirga aurantiaca]MBK6266033.1 dihydroorotase [Marivirga aurantiaca]
MRTYIKDVKIIASGTSLHQKTVSMLIENGRISEINPKDPGEVDVRIEKSGLMASASWFDMRVFSGEPGEEFREDLESLSNVLLAGGFGGALLMPNTQPVLQNRSDFSSVFAKNMGKAVKIYPASAVTINCDGENLNEMLDAHFTGVPAFTDGLQPLWNSDILVKSLQYLQKFDGLLMNFPQDKNLAMFGQMSEGVVSTGLGLKGIPHLAEELMIQRDLELLKYAGGKIHFSCLSSAKSVELIRQAKNEGLNVTCDVGIHHLILDDSHLETFDANYKVSPPLRTKKDIEALISGVNDGTIDVIVSAHQPYDQDHKKLEFDYAAFGIMGSQILFPLYQKFLKDKIQLNTFINCIASNPRKILKIVPPTWEVGTTVDLTLFTMEDDWLFDATSNQSRSDNSPFLNTAFKAKALAVFNQGQAYLDPNIYSA